MSLNVLHTIAGLRRSSGGPSRSVTELCNNLGLLELSVSLLSMDTHENLDDCIVPDQSVVKLQLARSGFLSDLEYRYPLNHFKDISRLHRHNPLHIIHDHGMWLPCNHATADAAHRLRVPFVVSPRGMLEPWALNFKSWKKKLAWRLWVGRDLNRVTAFCATAQMEAQNLRQLGFRQPIAIIPNGIDIKPSLGSKETYNRPIRQALFLSRIHPVKGVCELVEAWAKVRPAGWELVIAGPDEGGHAKAVHRCIAKHGLDDVVRLVGPVDGEAKWRLYGESELFVLPTFSENFGIVVAEALAMGTPVITTKGAPWGGLARHKCGWWIDIGVEPLAKALNEAINLSEGARRDMGTRGRRFVERAFVWKTIASKTQRFYLWLLGKGGKPDFVRGFGE